MYSSETTAHIEGLRNYHKNQSIKRQASCIIIMCLSSSIKNTKKETQQHALHRDSRQATQGCMQCRPCSIDHHDKKRNRPGGRQYYNNLPDLGKKRPSHLRLTQANKSIHIRKAQTKGKKSELERQHAAQTDKRVSVKQEERKRGRNRMQEGH
jgi:hypothetical protein